MSWFLSTAFPYLLNKLSILYSIVFAFSLYICFVFEIKKYYFITLITISLRKDSKFIYKKNKVHCIIKKIIL